MAVTECSQTLWLHRTKAPPAEHWQTALFLGKEANLSRAGRLWPASSQAALSDCFENEVVDFWKGAFSVVGPHDVSHLASIFFSACCQKMLIIVILIITVFTFLHSGTKTEVPSYGLLGFNYWPSLPFSSLTTETSIRKGGSVDASLEGQSASEHIPKRRSFIPERRELRKSEGKARTDKGHMRNSRPWAQNHNISNLSFPRTADSPLVYINRHYYYY